MKEPGVGVSLGLFAEPAHLSLCQAGAKANIRLMVKEMVDAGRAVDDRIMERAARRIIRARK